MKTRFTVRRYLVVSKDGDAEAHDFILVLDFDAIPNSHFRKALENKGRRRRMACGALTIVAQDVPDYKAGVPDNEQTGKERRNHRQSGPEGGADDSGRTGGIRDGVQEG